jgi:APA family basic amino acid/polyamine antiporter
MSTGICQYQLPTLLPDAAAGWLADTKVGPVSGTSLAAVVLATLLTLLNMLRLTVSAAVQMLLTLTPFGVLLVSEPAAASAAVERAPGTGHYGKAFLAVYFAYAGWNSLAYVAGEVSKPSRTLPLGLVGGTLSVTMLYLLLGGAFLAVLGLGGLRNAFEAGTATAGRLFGDGAQVGMAVLISLALLGSLNATILQGSRMICAMAQDRLLPGALARRDPRQQAPRRALALQWLLALALILAGSFETLPELTSIAMLWMSGLTVLALFILRKREPDRPRPYRALGYPLLPILFLIIMLGVIGVDVVRILNEGVGVAGLPLLGLGVFGVLYVAHRLVAGARS